jgi:hypothetical protein
MEALEARQLMSTATPLVITGTNGNDHVRLDCVGGIISVVRENVIVSHHVAADVSNINVDLTFGDDSLIMSGSLLLN